MNDIKDNYDGFINIPEEPYIALCLFCKKRIKSRQIFCIPEISYDNPNQLWWIDSNNIKNTVCASSQFCELSSEGKLKFCICKGCNGVLIEWIRANFAAPKTI